jgi:hypothetical protein
MKAERGGTLAEIIHVQGYSIITTNLIRGENTSRPVRDIVGRQLVGNAAPRRFPGNLAWVCRTSKCQEA